MQPTWPIRVIRHLPMGKGLALRIYNRALMHFAPRRRVKTYFGARMDCDVRDMIQATIIHFRAWEPRVSRVLEQLIEDGDTAVDVGANIGYYSLLFAKAVGPKGRVVAIEALPKLAAIVTRHADLNDAANIRVVNAAASNHRERVTLYEAPLTNIGMTTMRRERGFPAAATVQALPLDEILSSEEMANVSLIKIDIEGAEVPVIRRFLDTLDRFPRRPAIAVEASGESPEWSDLFNRLVSVGYFAYDLHNDYGWLDIMDDREARPTRLEAIPEKQTDILFINREI